MCSGSINMIGILMKFAQHVGTKWWAIAFALKHVHPSILCASIAARTSSQQCN
jgi:hypothetical protein